MQRKHNITFYIIIFYVTMMETLQPLELFNRNNLPAHTPTNGGIRCIMLKCRVIQEK